MNHRPVMQVLAVISALFGVMLLFAPNALMALYKAPELNGPGIYNSMTYGGSLIAIAVMNWVASSDTLHGARHVILGTLVANAIGFGVALQRQLTDANIPASAWGNVLLFAVLAALYVRLFMLQRASAMAGPAVAAG